MMVLRRLNLWLERSLLTIVCTRSHIPHSMLQFCPPSSIHFYTQLKLWPETSLEQVIPPKNLSRCALDVPMRSRRVDVFCLMISSPVTRIGLTPNRSLYPSGSCIYHVLQRFEIGHVLPKLSSRVELASLDCGCRYTRRNEQYTRRVITISQRYVRSDSASSNSFKSVLYHCNLLTNSRLYASAYV